MRRNNLIGLYLVFLVLAISQSVDIHAQIRGNNITVTVQPDHKDWNYKVGEQAAFTVNVLRSGTLLDHATIDYEAGPVMYPDVKKQHISLSDGTLQLRGSMDKPGFYRVKVTAHVDGKDYEGLC